MLVIRKFRLFLMSDLQMQKTTCRGGIMNVPRKEVTNPQRGWTRFPVKKWPVLSEIASQHMRGMDVDGSELQQLFSTKVVHSE